MGIKSKNQNRSRTKLHVENLHTKDNRVLFLMAIPGVLVLLMFNYLPLYGLQIAFKSYVPTKEIAESAWCGLYNFKFFFTSSDAIRTLRNTILYSLLFIIVDVFFGMGVGIALYNLKSNVARKVYNTIMILPRFLSMVLIAYVAYGLLAQKGVINTLLASLNKESISFYSEPKYWPYVITITHIWATVGINSILYLSSLSSLDTSLIEAARIDGANKWQVIRNVYIPHLYSVASILLILSIGTIFSGDFGLFYQVPMNLGTLFPTTDVVSTYIYRGLENGNFAVSAAVGLFQSVAGCIMVLISNAIIRKVSPENALF